MFIKDKNQGDDNSSLKRSERNDESGGSLSCYGVKERNHSLPETKGEEKHRKKSPLASRNGVLFKRLAFSP